jgi:xanthine dehydrogenase accessory factor
MQDDILSQILKNRAAKRPFVLATNLTSGLQNILYPTENGGSSELVQMALEALVADQGRLVETAEGQVFLNVFNPPLRLAVVGAVHIAQPLVQIARLANYDVTVIDPRRAFASAERFPGIALSHDWPDEALMAFRPDRRSAIVTLTHDPKLDDPALIEALKSDAFYIGSLGSRKTHAKRLDRLREAGFSDADCARIQGPVGLSIGAKSPAEIAVSIIAQITAVLREAGNRAKAETAA